MLAIHTHGIDWLSALMAGLEGYDQSLYREWLLDHEPKPTADAEDDTPPRLSYHAYTQDTMLLNQLLTQLTLLVQAYVRDKNDNPVIEPVFFQPPGLPRETEPVEATYESMKAWLGA